MKRGLLLPWSFLVGLLYLISNAEAARATTLILGKSKPEPKIDTLPTAEEEVVSVPEAPISNLSNETSAVGNVTKLTGVPQIDYIYDPNLPRELNGYNLTDYPFYNSVPEDIDFKCDGLHDGFYASVPHKCQVGGAPPSPPSLASDPSKVYHHCLFGTRYDFLCANYTAFDQKTFICHFASEVDCKNSPKYFVRNEALYKAATTTTPAPPPAVLAARRPSQESGGGRRRRPYRRKKPSYEYYDEYEDVAGDDYYDDGPGRRRKRPRPTGRDSYDDVEEEGDDKLPPSAPNKSVYDRPRVAPKIRRPVPVNEREKYDYSSDSRVIVKEPDVDKKRFEETETSNKKPSYYDEPTGSGHLKTKEPDTERDREREHKGDEYERERERDRDRDERPFRDRRPPKKRRRPDGLDDEYDEYDDVRKHRNRNKPRYEEYDEYDYDDRGYKTSQRNRDHDFDRERPYRDYDRPRNRDRIREDDRPIRNRDVDDRPPRIRDDDRPLRSRDDDRLPRPRDDDRLPRPRDDDRPPRPRDDDRPPRPRDDDRPPRPRDDDRPPRPRDDDRPPRTRDDDRPPRIRDDDRPQRTRDDDRPLRIRDDDRPPRVRDDDRPVRSRDDERPIRSRDAEKGIKSTKNRNRDEEKHYYDSEEDRYEKPREVVKTVEEPERPYKYKDDDGDPGKYSSEEDTYSRNRNRHKETGKGRPPSREEVEEPKPKQENFNNREQADRPFRGTTKQSTSQRGRPPVNPEDEDVEEQSKPVPASRPAYITKPTEIPTRKPFIDREPVRKQNSFKRPSLPRFPSVQDSAEETDKNKPELPPPTTERPRYESEIRQQQQQQQQQPAKYYPPEDIRGTIEQLNEKLLPVSPEEPVSQEELIQPRLRVPHEDSVPKEELAPRAPKFPQTSSKRRPFLPSRNGNANLPRGLQPVGVKALQTPRGFQMPKKEEPQQEPPEEKQSQEPRYQFPNNGGVEFRAKLSTAIGVDQPKLTQYFQDVQSPAELELPKYEGDQESSGVDAEYYNSGLQKEQEEQQRQSPFPANTGSIQRQPNTQDLSSSHVVPEYTSGTGQRAREESNIPPRAPPQLSITDRPPPPPPSQDNKNLEQTFRNRPLPSAINQQFTGKSPVLYPPPPPQPPSPQLQSQLGPQSFFSENPKFKTTIKIPEPYSFKPSAPSSNFNSGSNLPVYQAGIRTNLPNVKPEPVNYEGAQRQIDPPQESPRLNLKFPSQRDNVGETNEYDVSLNDALQPISTLHPRNVPTGVYLVNWNRNQQPSGAFNRRNFQESPQNVPQQFAPRNPPQQKTQKITGQRQAPSIIYQRFVQPPVYRTSSPVSSSCKNCPVHRQ